MTFDATDFGAVGDGIADDTGAIQAAIDAASLSSADDPVTIYVPAGLYALSEPPRIRENAS